MKKLIVLSPFYFELFRLGMCTVLFIFLSYLAILLWNPANIDGRLIPLNYIPGLNYNEILLLYALTILGIIISLDYAVRAMLNLKTIAENMVKELRAKEC